MENGLESYLKFLKGNQSAMKNLVRLYWDNMLLFTNSYVHNFADAEDIAQEAFVRLFLRRPKFEDEGQLKAYLFKICRNLAVNVLKKQKRHQEYLQKTTEESTEELEEIETRMEMQESAKVLHRCMQELKLQYREVLYLRYFEQLTIPECARVMRCTERQVTAIGYQARQALRKILEKEGYHIENI